MREETNQKNTIATATLITLSLISPCVFACDEEKINKEINEIQEGATYELQAGKLEICEAIKIINKNRVRIIGSTATENTILVAKNNASVPVMILEKTNNSTIENIQIYGTKSRVGIKIGEKEGSSSANVIDKVKIFNSSTAIINKRGWNNKYYEIEIRNASVAIRIESQGNVIIFDKIYIQNTKKWLEAINSMIYLEKAVLQKINEETNSKFAISGVDSTIKIKDSYIEKKNKQVALSDLRKDKKNHKPLIFEIKDSWITGDGNNDIVRNKTEYMVTIENIAGLISRDQEVKIIDK